MDKIAELEIRITELEGVVKYMLRNSVPFSLQAYQIVISDIKTLRIELADLKANLSLQTITQIKSN